MNEKAGYYSILIITFLLLFSLFTPLAFSKVSYVNPIYVWIFGSTSLIPILPHYSSIMIGFSILIVIVSIFWVIIAFQLSFKHKNKVKFAERLFITNFLILPISTVIVILIEYNFSLNESFPLSVFSLENFWTYFGPGFCNFGISLFPNILMLINLIFMHFHKSSFFWYSLILYFVNVGVMAFFFLY